MAGSVVFGGTRSYETCGHARRRLRLHFWSLGSGVFLFVCVTHLPGRATVLRYFLAWEMLKRDKPTALFLPALTLILSPSANAKPEPEPQGRLRTSNARRVAAKPHAGSHCAFIRITRMPCAPFHDLEHTNKLRRLTNECALGASWVSVLRWNKHAEHRKARPEPGSQRPVPPCWVLGPSLSLRAWPIRGVEEARWGRQVGDGWG